MIICDKELYEEVMATCSFEYSGGTQSTQSDSVKIDITSSWRERPLSHLLAGTWEDEKYVEIFSGYATDAGYVMGTG